MSTGCTRRGGGGVWIVLSLAALIGAASSPASPMAVEYHGDPVPPQVDAIYERGLAYLVSIQQEDGTWPNPGGQSGPGITGIVLLALMARGDDPGHGPMRDAVARGIRALVAAQHAESGYIGDSMYHHGFATLALAEAYGMVDEPMAGPALRRAVDLILVAQRDNPTGGWRYQPNAQDADTTVSGAQMIALLAARNAGLHVPDEAMQRGLAFFAACQSQDGGIGYTDAGSGNGVRTAIALAVASIAGERGSPLAVRAAQFLGGQAERGGTGGAFYYLYYAAQAWFHFDMDQWRAWNEVQVRRLAESQARDGHWRESQGATVDTAWGLLALALHYRSLPIYERN